MPTIVALIGIIISAAGLWAIVLPEGFHQSAARWLLPRQQVGRRDPGGGVMVCGG
jgi:hypothetical protein